jgi:hypothetical protein
MTIDLVARQASVLGLKLSARLYPVGAPIRDAAQLKYIGRFIDRIAK